MNDEENRDGPVVGVPAWVDDPVNRDVLTGHVMVVIHMNAHEETLQMWTNLGDEESTIAILEECARHAREIFEMNRLLR